MKRVLTIILFLLMVSATALSETVYVLCQPNSFVNVRQFPRKSAEVAGRVELGWELETDGVKKNGFLKVYGSFEGEAWINCGFVTYEPVTIMTLETEITSKGRVACRRSIKGTRRKWLLNGQKVVIFALASDWAVTDHGFIQTKYLGVF